MSNRSLQKVHIKKMAEFGRIPSPRISMCLTVRHSIFVEWMVLPSLPNQTHRLYCLCRSFEHLVITDNGEGSLITNLYQLIKWFIHFYQSLLNRIKRIICTVRVGACWNVIGQMVSHPIIYIPKRIIINRQYGGYIRIYFLPSTTKTSFLLVT